MIVVDTSAILGSLIGRPVNSALVHRLADDGDLHAPHLVDIEFLHGLRRLVLTGELAEERATDARGDFADLVIRRYPHEPLADRVWGLRHNLSAYDAAFVALSELLKAPLVTMDFRLETAPGHRARVEVFARA